MGYSLQSSHDEGIEHTFLIIANEDGSPFFGENQGVATSKDSTLLMLDGLINQQQERIDLLSPLSCYTLEPM